MAPADDDTARSQIDRREGMLRRPVRIPAPDAVRRAIAPVDRELAGKVVNVTARILVVVIPAVLAVVGLLLALLAAALSERDGFEAIGTLGLEVGAAMWFAGAVTLGARPGPTVLRIALLATTGLGGLALIAVAIVAGWSGVRLDLAMEFGVGAMAIVVLDIVILGVIQARLDRLTAPNPFASPAPSER